MKKLRWREEDVVAYIEHKINLNMASDEEFDLYLNFTYARELKKNYTYKQLIKEMKKQYLGK